jgi:hypothetical protein
MNTGWKRYQNLIEVYEDTGVPTGNVKPNVDTDYDFVSDVWSPDSCPYIGYDPLSGSTSGTTNELPSVFHLSYSVSSINSGGTLSASPNNTANEYIEGTVVTVTAIENVGYDLMGFQGFPGTVSGNTLTLTMDSDKNILALFIPEKRKVTVESGGGGVKIRIGNADMNLVPGVYMFDYNTIIKIIGSFVDSDMATCGIIIDEWGNQTSGNCAVISGNYDSAFLNNSFVLINTQLSLTSNIILRGALVCDTTNCL